MDNSSELGVCSTCNHTEECISKKNSKGPVLYCEEIDTTVSGGPKKRETTAFLNSKNEQSKIEQSKVQEESICAGGLCVNCLHRTTCTFPKKQGGVWHCEEYL